ncbi:MAG: ABC transporter ATP-binding protein [Candidatus Aminicenantes bacterium]|nr:ABC transporter ATP-binding protein [Candidatus Aminicenantes bacterium]
MTPVLEAKNLTKRYHDFTLKDISVEIPPGSITAFFGPTGAGKTTLMKLLTRQIPATSGAVRVFGLAYDDREREIKSRIGYVPQEPVCYKDRSVEFNARFAASFYERWDGGAFYRMLDEFRVGREKAVKRLSRGQKTLFAIALALSHEADLLILDEPTAGLDAILRRAILERLRKFVADGERTVIVSSHITDGLEDIAEYVNFLSDGRLVFQSEKDELLARWKRIHFKDGALPPDLVGQLADVRQMPFGSSGLTRDFSALRERLASGIAAGDVKVENATLDDILIAMHQGE